MTHIAMNRRIGSRTSVRIPVTIRRPTSRFSLRGPRRVEAVITNLSVTGLEVSCHPIPDLALRDRVIIETETGNATAELRRIETLDKKQVHYGLLLLEMDAPFEKAMNQIATGMGSDEFDWRWDAAR
jgi:hypothetical protein